MKLSLSVRVAESFHSKTSSSLSLEEIVDIAQSLGYDALCMRASQAGVHSPREIVAELARSIRDAELEVSMITGDFDVPRNDEKGPSGLRAITPYLDLAETFGADLIRVCMKTESDIAAARQAADEARERGIRLAHQSHFASLFETVKGSIEVLRAVDRSNFGLIYEPANWMFTRQDYLGAIRELEPWIFNVYLQNHRVTTDGQDHVDTWTCGRVDLDHIGLWETGGVHTEKVLEELRDIGYIGFVTVHQAFEGVMPPGEAARKSFEYLHEQRG